MVTNPRCNVWNYFDNIVEEGIAVCKLCKQRLKNDRSWCLKKHLKKLHNTKSEIWNYFDNIVGEGMAVCKQCKQRVRNNRSVNLTQHLENAHNIIVANIAEGTTRKELPVETSNRNLRPKVDNVIVYITDDDSKEEEPAKTNQVDVSIVENNTPIVENITPIVNNIEPIVISNNNELEEAVLKDTSYRDIPLNSVSNSKRKMSRLVEANYKRAKTQLSITMDEKTLISAVWGLMIEDGVTPLLFGSKNMQALIQPICDAICKQQDKELKIEESESERLLCLVANHMRSRFSNDLDCRLLSLKLDMDINGPENTFCISTLFVDNGRTKTRTLGVIDLKDDPQLTEQHIKQVLHKYNIDSNQIISIFWDNSKPNYNRQVQNCEYIKEIEMFEKYPEIKFGDIKIERYVGVIAQLCLLDVLKNSHIFQSFLECRNLAKFIHDDSNGYYGIFQQNNLNIPKLDSPWKWGSTYEMMYDLHEARSILKAANISKFEHPEDKFNVNDNMWLFIDAFCESIGFIQKSIIKYYSDEMHFGDFYPQWLKTKLLTAKLATASNMQNTYIATISVELLKSIEARSKELLGKGCFDACLYLDPRFHHSLGEEEKTKALKYLKSIWSRYKIYNVDVINAAAEENVVSQRFDDAEDAFLNEYLCQDAPEPDLRTADVHKKIEGFKMPFKPVDTNILSFWNNQKSDDPEMHSLSTICFAIPTTQNYNKHHYAHIYQTETLSKLSSFTRDNLVSIRLNSQLLEGNLRQFGIFHEAMSSDDDELQIVDNNEAAPQVINLDTSDIEVE